MANEIKTVKIKNPTTGEQVYPETSWANIVDKPTVPNEDEDLTDYFTIDWDTKTITDINEEVYSKVGPTVTGFWYDGRRYTLHFSKDDLIVEYSTTCIDTKYELIDTPTIFEIVFVLDPNSYEMICTKNEFDSNISAKLIEMQDYIDYLGKLNNVSFGFSITMSTSEGTGGSESPLKVTNEAGKEISPIIITTYE